MSEAGIGQEGRIKYGPEDRRILNHVDSAVGRLRKAARYYSGMRRLLSRHTFSSEGMQIPTEELLGSQWKYVFTRHSQSYIDLEIKKLPLRAGSDTIEHVLRLRRGADPLARSSRLSQSRGVERYENGEEAYSEVDSFIADLIGIL